MTRRMQIAGCSLIAVSTALCGCATRGGDQPAGFLAPDGFAPGWQMDGAVREFTEETLFDHINGEAELFYPYGFRLLRTANYASGDGSIQADLYEMGSPLDGFGIYSNYRSPGAQSLPIGTECMAGTGQLVFCHDRFFGRLTAVGRSEDADEALAACARAIAGNLPGDPVPPPELKSLDVEGVDRGTIQYVAESLLGYAVFPRGLFADAVVNGNECRAFVVMTETETDAARVLMEYTAYLAAEGVEAETTSAGLVARDPLHRGVCLRQVGSFLAGVARLEDTAACEPLVSSIAAAIEAL